MQRLTLVSILIGLANCKTAPPPAPGDRWGKWTLTGYLDSKELKRCLGVFVLGARTENFWMIRCGWDLLLNNPVSGWWVEESREVSGWGRDDMICLRVGNCWSRMMGAWYSLLFALVYAGNFPGWKKKLLNHVGSFTKVGSCITPTSPHSWFIGLG